MNCSVEPSMINVSNIECFATHDGPGIRTTVFLKGCSLHCPWCANPETWSVQPVLMHDEKKCVQCKSCQHVCPKKAISFPFHWDAQACAQCGACVNVCLQEALSFAGQTMSIEEVVEEVLKDRAYYQKSNGGVTISGGEPFVQFDGFLSLLKACKEEGLHVAVETTGNYPLERLKKALPYIDLFLMDCKHLNAEKLKEVTGGKKDWIETNFRYLAEHCPKKVIVRMPVIPRFNDDICQEVIDFASRLHLAEVNLLPFHTLGKNKWHQLQRDFIYEHDKMMKKEDLQNYVAYGEACGVHVKIGG